MLYEFNDDATSIDINSINKNILTIGYISLKELNDSYKSLGLSAVAIEQCKQEFNIFSTGITYFEDFDLVKISTAKSASIALFIKKNLLLIVAINDKEYEARNSFMNTLSFVDSQAMGERELCSIFLLELISKDMLKIEALQKSISQLEEEILIKRRSDSINLELIRIKGQLLDLRCYYEQLEDIGEGFNFSSFSSRAKRLKENIDLLQGNVIHLWDCYQAQLDMRLNERMKTFTLLTTIFFPVTIIVGWYGMNFSFMPELKWRYGYIYVISLTVAVVIALIYIFKKKDWI